MKLLIPRRFTLNISVLFLLFLFLLSFFPVQHKVHCNFFLYYEKCPYETVFLGEYVFTHVFGFFIQVFSFLAGSFFYEMAEVFAFFIISFFLGDFLFNRFLKSKYSEVLPNFLKKKISLSLFFDKRLFLNVLLFFVSLLLCLVFIELLFRGFYPELVQKADFNNTLFNKYDDISWFNIPNVSSTMIGENNYPVRITHNNFGFRSSEDLVEKGKKRILLLGDSFIYGTGLDENETLDYFLQTELGDSFEVINAGVNAYNAVQELYYLLKIYEKVKPDLVLVGILLNDFRENIFPENNKKLLFESEEINIKSLVKNSKQNFFDDLGKRYNNKFWNDFEDSFNSLFENYRSFLLSHSVFFKFLEKNRDAFLNVKDERYRGHAFLFAKHPDELTKFALATECAILNKFQFFLNQNKLPYLFFYIPERSEIETWRINNTVKKYYDLSLENVDLNRPLEELTACTRNSSINFLSLKNKFLENKTDLYNKQGNHWSPKGTKAAAKVLKEEIRSRKLIT